MGVLLHSSPQTFPKSLPKLISEDPKVPRATRRQGGLEEALDHTSRSREEGRPGVNVLTSGSCLATNSNQQLRLLEMERMQLWPLFERKYTQVCG